mmetsp:Transcript_25611/g.60031  ORF Transcript_25611/g.60031 Transcript_25611/m.60031 type:complete len:267 (+) Transcript_25611:1162-1962(+)
MVLLRRPEPAGAEPGPGITLGTSLEVPDHVPRDEAAVPGGHRGRVPARDRSRRGAGPPGVLPRPEARDRPEQAGPRRLRPRRADARCDLRVARGGVGSHRASLVVSLRHDIVGRLRPGAVRRRRRRRGRFFFRTRRPGRIVVRHVAPDPEPIAVAPDAVSFEGRRQGALQGPEIQHLDHVHQQPPEDENPRVLPGPEPRREAHPHGVVFGPLAVALAPNPGARGYAKRSVLRRREPKARCRALPAAESDLAGIVVFATAINNKTIE